MDGLLGVRANEDAYVRALLMVDGVTSVTIDRVGVGACRWRRGLGVSGGRAIHAA
jgi:hypothetical protein